ncbi:MAG: hypothetical protein IJA05_00045 [Oscillospiraceae bacterium]|nr:hypothetical protein [Oscillospiraceae bacterium]
MQREAENRVREMQSRARLIGGNENNFSLPQKPVPLSSERKNPVPQNPISNLLSGTDSEKLIILALLWILWNEKADPKLLLALLYLLL